jgi:hypothetical protein
LSVTLKETDVLAAVVGIPEMTPLVLSDKLAGKLPEMTVHEYGDVPPVAIKDCE